jgi:hypothetical protein
LKDVIVGHGEGASASLIVQPVRPLQWKWTVKGLEVERIVDVAGLTVHRLVGIAVE